MSNLTTIFNDADRLRAYFMERGWSIHMEDNGRSVIDPFATIIEAVQGAAITARMRAAFDEGIRAEAAQGAAPLDRCSHCNGGGCAVCYGTGQSEGAAPRAEGHVLTSSENCVGMVEDAYQAGFEDGRAAPRAEGLDPDALYREMWEQRHALDAGIYGFSPHGYRAAARRIASRLSRPSDEEAHDG